MNDEKMDKKTKIILISGISVTGIALLSTIISILFPPKAPDPKQLGPQTKIKYMASKEFTRLPESEKERYISKIGRPSRNTFNNLSEDERKTVMQTTHKVMHKKMQARMKKEMKKFFKMSKSEQDAFLDKMIAEHEKRRAEMEARRAANGNNGNNRGGGPPPGGGNRQAMMQNMLENTDSTTRAQMDAFFKRMHERRQQTQKK